MLAIRHGKEYHVAMSRILVVDDEPAILHTLRDLFLSCGHQVNTACDGQEGLDMALEGEYDLVLSDISMPRLSGIELLSRLEIVRPEIHRVLLTAHTLEDYIDQLVGHNLSCVLTKSVPFPVQEVLVTVESLLSGSIFGIHRHLPTPTRHEGFKVRTYREMVELCDSLTLRAPERRRNHLQTILSEVLTNAVYYGSLDMPGDHKETWTHDFTLPEDKAVHVEFAEDNGRMAITVSDQGGRLQRQTVLHWLKRQMSRDENGLPEGIFDNHGRGFFISRSFSDRLSISIERGRRCEVTLLLYHQGMPPLGEKPLVILEI
jgi:CheY-like chemotaxis protein